EPMVQRGLAILHAQPVPSPADLGELENELGLIRIQQIRFGEAVSCFDEALFAAQPASNVELELAIRENRAKARKLLGQLDAAEQELEQVHAERVARDGAESETALGTRMDLALVRADLGRLDEARVELEDTSRILAARYGERSNRARMSVFLL